MNKLPWAERELMETKQRLNTIQLTEAVEAEMNE